MQKQLILFAIFGVFAAIAPAACTRTAAGDRPWVEYETSSGRLQRIEFDANKNGRNLMESVANYTPDHVVSRVEVSTHRDGTFNRVAYYTNGILDHAEEDTNGDARVRDGAVARVGTVPDGDGRFAGVDAVITTQAHK